MKRYDIKPCDIRNPDDLTYGDYVLNDDAQAEIDALKAEIAALKEGPDYKAILFALCASLAVSWGNLDDEWEDTVVALKRAGVSAEELDAMQDFQDILEILPKPVMSLYGPMEEE